MDSSQGKGEFKSMEKRVLGTRPPPHKDRVVLNCPRCNSPNTKFCYYNNYSMSQPRYFCKSCRRYWTEGGTLRNVPIGGGSRKNRRAFPLPRSSSCTTSRSSSRSFPCPPKAVSAPVNVFLSGAPGSLSSRNPSFGLRDLALAGNVWLPGTLPLPTEKFLEHGRSGAAFPDSATETGVSPVGLAIGSPSLTITPHFTTPAAVEPLVFPFDFPLEAAMQRICGGGMDTRGLMELQVGGVGDEELQTQGDQSNNHQGLWGGGGGGGGGYLGAGPW